ncbi:MAG: hypothetical protein RL556_275 [Actinomycetota bacterium]|jgi:hypothetical protein
MEIAFLVVYAVIIALVTPYIIGESQFYGKLVPASLALVWGALVWSILTWVGMPYDQAWIWIITMFSMPVAMYLGVFRFERSRKANPALNEKAADFIKNHKPSRFALRKQASEEDVYVTN